MEAVEAGLFLPDDQVGAQARFAPYDALGQGGAGGHDLEADAPDGNDDAGLADRGHDALDEGDHGSSKAGAKRRS